MSLATENFHRSLTMRAGVVPGSATPRIQNVTKSVDLCGFLDPHESANKFKSMHIMDGIFSALLSQASCLENGNLIYDRFHGKYGYVTELFADEAGCYEATVYMCNSLVTIAHPAKTLDTFKREAISWTTTVHGTNIRALISLMNYLAIETTVAGSKADSTTYYCYTGFGVVAHQGDRVYDGTKYYMVTNIDDVSWNGGLKCLQMEIASV